VLLNWRDALAGDAARRLADVGNVLFDIAMLENPGGVERLTERVTARRVVFGSHFPLYYFEAALFKVHEAGFQRPDETAITTGNASRMRAG
jgi:predicted TIM-barrel fold metal-dependent hydrolase